MNPGRQRSGAELVEDGPTRTRSHETAPLPHGQR